MKISGSILIKIFFGFCLATVLASCAASGGGNVNSNVEKPTAANTQSANQPGDDIAELNTKILMPELPDEVVWKETDAPNQGGKKLVAVMKFADENAKKIVELAEKIKPGVSVATETEDWFPEELVAQSQISGDETLKGIVYSPRDFIQQPYSNGRLIKIENSSYFILELTEK